MIRKNSRFLMTVVATSFLCVAAIAQDQVDAVPAETTAVDSVSATETIAEPTPSAEEEPAPVAKSEQTAAEQASAKIDEARQEHTVPLPDLSEDVPAEKALLEQLRLRKPPVDIEKMPSLFLTVWERDLVINARKGQLARDPDAPEDIAEIPPESLNAYEGPRDLRLSGIVWRSSKDWVIWLNARRITPTAIPKEVMDIKVYKDYIELEWFDAGTNQIFPVRLRPQQRFNMDARIFLPG